MRRLERVLIRSRFWWDDQGANDQKIKRSNRSRDSKNSTAAPSLNFGMCCKKCLQNERYLLNLEGFSESICHWKPRFEKWCVFRRGSGEPGSRTFHRLRVMCIDITSQTRFYPSETHLESLKFWETRLKWSPTIDRLIFHPVYFRGRKSHLQFTTNGILDCDLEPIAHYDVFPDGAFESSFFEGFSVARIDLTKHYSWKLVRVTR